MTPDQARRWGVTHLGTRHALGAMERWLLVPDPTLEWHAGELTCLPERIGGVPDVPDAAPLPDPPVHAFAPLSTFSAILRLPEDLTPAWGHAVLDFITAYTERDTLDEPLMHQELAELGDLLAARVNRPAPPARTHHHVRTLIGVEELLQPDTQDVLYLPNPRALATLLSGIVVPGPVDPTYLTASGLCGVDGGADLRRSDALLRRRPLRRVFPHETVRPRTLRGAALHWHGDRLVLRHDRGTWLLPALRAADLPATTL